MGVVLQFPSQNTDSCPRGVCGACGHEYFVIGLTDKEIIVVCDNCNITVSPSGWNMRDKQE